MSKEAYANSAQMYFSGSLGVLVSRAVGIVAGIVSLWLLTRILSVEAFAGYMLAMSLVFVLGFVASFGLERVLLLKISPLTPDPGHLWGGRLARKIAVWVALLSAATAVLTIIVLQSLPALSAKNDLAGWFLILSPIVPAVAMTALLVAWLQSNHSVGRPQTIYGQVDGLRCLGFGLVFAVGAGAWAVALAAVVASILPPTIMAARTIGKSTPEPGDFELSDVWDGLYFFAMRFATIGFLHADILILGLFAPPEVLGPYVVASRFALILEAGLQIFAPAYTPRARRHIEAGAPSLAAREYGVSRTLGFLASGTAALCFMIVGQPLLNQFGAGDEAFNILLLLCAGQLLLVGAGLHAIHMSMSDHLRLATAIQLGCLLIFVSLLLLLVPKYAAFGAAISFVIAQALLAASGTLVLWRIAGIRAWNAVGLISYAAAVGALICAGLAPAYLGPAAVILLLSLGLLAVRELDLLKSILKESLAQLTGSGR